MQRKENSPLKRKPAPLPAFLHHTVAWCRTPPSLHHTLSNRQVAAPQSQSFRCCSPWLHFARCSHTRVAAPTPAPCVRLAAHCAHTTHSSHIDIMSTPPCRHEVYTLLSCTSVRGCTHLLYTRVYTSHAMHSTDKVRYHTTYTAQYEQRFRSETRDTYRNKLTN